MFLAAAGSGAAITPILIALLGGGGITGAIVALIKIRPDISSASISQAQGAMEVMESLQEELRKALAEEKEQTARWKDRYLRERDQRLALERRWGPFQMPTDDDTPST